MSEFIPINDLDRALLALQRSHAATPDFYRALAEGELWFLVKYHPEIEGEVLELKNGSPVPFVSFEEKNGPAVAIFSSEERVNEGLKKGRVPPRTFSGGSMPAKQLLEILGKMGLKAVVNKGCVTGQIVIPPELMRDLASGRALEPERLDAQTHKQGRLKIINPADYPTNLVQAVFEAIRHHAQFRAAWVFDSSLLVKQPVKGRCYQLLFLMSPRDEALFHDVNMTIQAAREEQDDVGLGLLDESDDAYIARLFQQARPFYQATDYSPPATPPA